MKILIVDDEKIKRTTLRDDLIDAGHQATAVASAAEGLRLLHEETFSAVVTDLRMQGMDGLEFLERIKEGWPQTDVIMITAFATVDTAVEAMKRGAFDYLTKPFESSRLVSLLEKIARIRSLEKENADLKAMIQREAGYGGMVAESEAMHRVFDAIDQARSSDVPVLICGETGTGKERVAKAIFEGGPRAEGPFITINCVALSPQLLESELFGHERGAFTGAVASKPGRFEMADGGTLFLDEIDDIPLEMQPKLLRVLEGHPFERVGGTKSFTADVRFISASKVDLRRHVAEGRFREDLFYRISVFPIWLPPLRERKEDIPLLAAHFLKLHAPEQPVELDPAVVQCFGNYRWPGNVRELQNVVRRILVGLGGRTRVQIDDVPAEVRCSAMDANAMPTETGSLREVIESHERSMLVRALDDAKGNQSRAASSVGMKLSTFRDKLSKYDIHTFSPRQEKEEA